MADKSQGPCAIISAPDVSVHLSVAQIDIASITEAIAHHPDLCFYTNFDLQTQAGASIFESPNWLDGVKNNEISLKLKVLEYGERELVQHAQKLLRITFTLSTKFQYSDVRQSVTGWLTRNFSDKLPSVKDLDLPVPQSFTEERWGSALKFVDVARSEVSMKERLDGVLLKLEVKTNEGNTVIVKGAKDGWFVKDKRFVCLSQLLKTVSESYNSNYFLMAKKWCELDLIEQTKYHPIHDTNCFKPARVNKRGELVCQEGLRLMNDESKVALTFQIDDEIEKAEEEDGKLVSEMERAFVGQVLDAITMVKRGLALPAGEGRYMWNDLFVSNIDAVAEFYADRGGRVSAEKSVRNEIRLFQKLRHIQKGVRVSRTVLVDYFNERWVVQALIPGLVSHHAKIVHGPSPEDRKVFNIDPEFKEFFANAADVLGLEPSPIKSCNEPVLSSSEVNGVIGTDGFKYILDMHRATPRDANYPDPVKHHAFVVRDEAIVLFEEFSALEAHSAELVALGGKKELGYRPDEKMGNEAFMKLLTRRREIAEKAPKLKFDVNALTLDSKAKSTPKNITELGKFIVDVMVPQFVHDVLLQDDTVNSDVVASMHRFGLNARYLGRVTENVSKQEATPLHRAIKLVLESEIIARAFKAIIRALPGLSICEFLSKLNTLVGLGAKEDERKKLFEEVKSKSQEKFNYSPALPEEGQRVLILRSVLIQFGIAIAGGKFDAPLKPDNVVSIKPVVAFPYTVHSCIDLENALADPDREKARQLCEALASDKESPSCQFDGDVGKAHFNLSMINMMDEKLDQGVTAFVQYMMGLEVHYDQLDCGTIRKYATIADLAQRASKAQLAFTFTARAAHLAHLLAPFHPWAVQTFIKAAKLALETDGQTSLQYLELALASSEKIGLPNDVPASIYHEMSVAHIRNGNLKEAVNHEQMAFDKLPSEEYKRSLELLKAEIQKRT